MKILKKALIASAMLSAFATQAATVTSNALELSAEGVLAGVQAQARTLTFDIVVSKNHPAASTITLSFDKNVELFGAASDLNCGTGSVTQVVGTGKAVCGDIGFNYGTGSFTFDNVKVIDGDASKNINDSISFDVNLGNALTADSAFRIVLGQHGFDTTAPGVAAMLVEGASVLSYSSMKTDKSVIETGTGTIAKEVKQFSFAVKSKLDGIIQRDNQLSFVNGSTTTDIAAVMVNNNESLGLAITDAQIDVELEGNFKGFVGGAGTNPLSVDDNQSKTTVIVDSGFDTIVDFDANTFAGVVTGTVTTYPVKSVTSTLTYTTDGKQVLPATNKVLAKATVRSGTLYQRTGTKAFPTGGIIIDSKLDAGEWLLDATVINIPYFPINYTDTSTSVHFANESDKVSDVIVTAIDNNGTEYGPLDLGFDLNANTVTKVSQTVIAGLFKITANTKLSVTFNIDADKGDVNAYALTQNAKGRSEVSTSQQRNK